MRIFLILLVLTFALSSCDREGRHSLNRPGVSSDSTQVSADRSAQRHNGSRSPNSGANSPSTYDDQGGRINSSPRTPGRLPLNNYEYSYPGWANRFLKEIEKRELDLPSSMYSQELKDFFDYQRTPEQVAEVIEAYCEGYIDYVVSNLSINWEAVGQLTESDTTKMPIFIKHEMKEGPKTKK